MADARETAFWAQVRAKARCWVRDGLGICGIGGGFWRKRAWERLDTMSRTSVSEVVGTREEEELTEDDGVTGLRRKEREGLEVERSGKIVFLLGGVVVC